MTVKIIERKRAMKPITNCEDPKCGFPITDDKLVSKSYQNRFGAKTRYYHIGCARELYLID
jgi:hypothetical protein